MSSSSIEAKAADAALGAKAYSLATAASSTRINLPTEMAAAFCWFAAEGLDVWIRFGLAASVTVSKTAVSVVASQVLTEDATSPHLYIPAGTMVSRRMLVQWTAFAHISTTTTGFLRFGRDQGSYGAASES